MGQVRHNQSGYAGSSRSVRATHAEGEGKLPLTRLCRKYGYSQSKAKAALEPCEAHHTSKYANLTDYYDPARALRFRRQISVRKPTAEQLAARAAVMEAAIEDARDVPQSYL